MSKDKKAGAAGTTAALIAAVMVTCYVNGVRTDVQPGEPLPDDLPEHDIEQLKKMGAIKDPEVEAKAEGADKAATRAGNKAFQAAREEVKGAAASTATPEAGAETKEG